MTFLKPDGDLQATEGATRLRKYYTENAKGHTTTFFRRSVNVIRFILFSPQGEKRGRRERGTT